MLSPDSLSQDTPIDTAAAENSRYSVRILYVFIFVACGISSLVVGNYLDPIHFEVTSTWSSTTGEGIIGKNSDLSYPVYLKGEKCFEEDFYRCTLLSTSSCCVELYNPSSRGPEEGVTTLVLLSVSLVLPITLLALRHLLVRRPIWVKKVFKKLTAEACIRNMNEFTDITSQPKWHSLVKFYSVDAWIGLLASVCLSSIITELMKVFVGRPRPNYYALLYFVEHSAAYADSVSKEARHARTSWISGHSSLSASGVLFMVLVLWRDVSCWPIRFRHFNHILIITHVALFGLLCVFLSSLLIGISRITGYWHRPDDVIAGWIVGFLSAYYSWNVVTCGLHKINLLTFERTYSEGEMHCGQNGRGDFQCV